MRRVFFLKGQNLLDLALILSVVGLVFVGMQTYIKRGLQSKVKDITDSIVSSNQMVDYNLKGQAGQVDRTHMTLDSVTNSIQSEGGSKVLDVAEHTFQDYVTNSL